MPVNKKVFARLQKNCYSAAVQKTLCCKKVGVRRTTDFADTKAPVSGAAVACKIFLQIYFFLQCIFFVASLAARAVFETCAGILTFESFARENFEAGNGTRTKKPIKKCPWE
jgi:hypothetical protein